MPKHMLFWQFISLYHAFIICENKFITYLYLCYNISQIYVLLVLVNQHPFVLILVNLFWFLLKGQTKIVPGRCSACSNPCIGEYPSCKGLENGFQAWPSKPNKEYWVVCYKNACWKKEGAKKILTGNRGHYLIMEHAPAFLLFPENLFHPALGNLMEISTRHNSFLRVPGYATLIITVKMA